MHTLSKIGVAATIVFICVLFIGGIQSPKTITDKAPATPTQYHKKSDMLRVSSIAIPSVMTFAGEQVPLQDTDVRERLDREIHVNTYWHSNMLLMIKKSNRFFSQIEPLLKKYNLPDDFKYLAVAESGLDNVTSAAGASGFWQFMRATAKQYGLEVNSYVDERYNLELATRVAAEYLHDSKELFGTWTNAAAAYNAGNAGISKQMKRQNTTSYYNLLLNSETGRYVFRILAFKEILSNPEKYGFFVDQNDLYQAIPTKTMVIDTPITDLTAFAKQQGISYKTLKIHNPWLRDTYLKNASGKKYYIKIPKTGYYLSQ